MLNGLLDKYYMTNGLGIEFELKGKDLIEMISMVIIGGLGMLPTCGAGCSSRYLKE